ncbi:MAG TPA: hypothetical protein VFB32_17430 [Rudaea sp.]|nr:hypothetical protein [Rudaea sp.]
MVLQALSESSALVRGAAMAMLTLHIAGGGAGILSGVVAIFARKGNALHIAAGRAFFASMLLMAIMAVVLSVMIRERANVVGGIFAAYLVATAWMAVRRAPGTIGRFEYAACFVAIGCALADFSFGIDVVRGARDRDGPVLYFVFAAIIALAATLDVSMIRRGGLVGVQRIARHLWRMSFALFFATGSFFLGQQKVMPLAMRGSPVLIVLGLAPLVLMLYWLVRVRIGRTYSTATAPAHH